MVRTGPRFERPDENGIAHLVEHLLFRGTERHPESLDFHAAVESIGGEINGMTQRDATTIHLTVPPRHLNEGIELLAEVCTQPRLTGLNVELDVVVEEILDTLDADGNDLDLDTLSRRVLWGDHPMGQPVAGEIELVETFTEAECRSFFEKTFVTRNAVLVIAGPHEPKEVVAQADRAFARMRNGPALPEPQRPVNPPHPAIHVQPTDDAQVSMLLSFPAPDENHPDFGRLMLLRRLLDDGFASRLRQSICERRGLAYSLSVGVDAYQDAGVVDVEVTCAPKRLFAVLEQILSDLDDLRRAPVRRDELSRAKTRHFAELEFGLDDPQELASWHGASELLGLRVSSEARQREVQEATPEEMQRLCGEVFQTSAALLTLVGPVDERVVSRLERLLGRAAGSTLWMGSELHAEPDPDGSEPKPLRVA